MSKVRVIKRFCWLPMLIGNHVLWLQSIKVYQVWDVRTVYCRSEAGSPIGAIHKAEGWFDILITTPGRVKVKSILWHDKDYVQ